MSHFEYDSFYKISKHKNTVFVISIHYIHLLIQIFFKKNIFSDFPNCFFMVPSPRGIPLFPNDSDSPVFSSVYLPSQD